MPTIQKRNTRKRPHRSKRPPTTKMPAYPLDDHWVSKGDKPLDPTAVPLPRHQRDPHALSPAEAVLWLTARGWPMTPDKSRRLTDDEIEATAARLRSKLKAYKPTLLGTRVDVAREYAAMNRKKPLAAQSRIIIEAENEAVLAMRVAYRRQSRDTRKQRRDAALVGVGVRQKGCAKWQDFARQVHKRGGEETPEEMAVRIQDLLYDAGYLPWSKRAAEEASGRHGEKPRPLWKDRSPADRDDTDDNDDNDDPDDGSKISYFPTIDVIVRYVRDLAKTQPE